MTEPKQERTEREKSSPLKNTKKREQERKIRENLHRY